MNQTNERKSNYRRPSAVVGVILASILVISICGVDIASGLTKPNIEETQIQSLPVFEDRNIFKEIEEERQEINKLRVPFKEQIDVRIEELEEYLTDEQKDVLKVLLEQVDEATILNDLTSSVSQIENILSAAREARTLEEERIAASSAAQKEAESYNYYYNESPTYYSNRSGLTMQSGVNYYDGRRETYYSSNVLYHYRTSEWTLDDEGFYRTRDGYYVVATSDMAQGTTFEGSKGTCIVLDSGCAAGTTDYYVGW